MPVLNNTKKSLLKFPPVSSLPGDADARRHPQNKPLSSSMTSGYILTLPPHADAAATHGLGCMGRQSPLREPLLVTVFAGLLGSPTQRSKHAPRTQVNPVHWTKKRFTRQANRVPAGGVPSLVPGMSCEGLESSGVSLFDSRRVDTPCSYRKTVQLCTKSKEMWGLGGKGLEGGRQRERWEGKRKAKRRRGEVE